MDGSNGRHSTPAIRVAGIAAGACFVLALLAFGAALDGYAHAWHPVALLGATGIPRATAFNLLAYGVPGVLAAFVAVRRRGGLGPDARLSARLGWNLALLAALAFAAQGLFPLDPSGPDAGPARLHAVAWGAWGIAFAAAGVALAVAAARARRIPSALVHAAAGALVFSLAWLAGEALPLAIAQRAACACWLAWLVFAAWFRAGDARD